MVHRGTIMVAVDFHPFIILLTYETKHTYINYSCPIPSPKSRFVQLCVKETASASDINSL